MLIDEAAGRTVAESYGVEAFGTIRVLLDAKSARLIAQVTPLLCRLIEELRLIHRARALGAHSNECRRGLTRTLPSSFIRRSLSSFLLLS